MTNNVEITHIEKHLGAIDAGWQDRDKTTPFQVIQTKSIMDGLHNYLTLGLHRFSLRSNSSQKLIRHELLISVRCNSEPMNIPAVLQDLGRQAIDCNCAFLRGEVIGPRSGAVILGTKFTALYVAMPVYWPSEFATCVKDDGTSFIFAWLVPITTKEAHFVFDFGWDKFEDKLVESNCDMCDLTRNSTV